jgi:hypothetical protein
MYIIGSVVFMILVMVVVIYLTNDDVNINKSNETPEHLFSKPSNIKFETSWFSDDYVTPHFLYNGRWISLNRVGKPRLGLENNWVENVNFSLGNGDFDYEKEKWGTIGQCLEHNKKVNLECEENNKSLSQQRKSHEEGKRAAFKRANS